MSRPPREETWWEALIAGILVFASIYGMLWIMKIIAIIRPQGLFQ